MRFYSFMAAFLLIGNATFSQVVTKSNVAYRNDTIYVQGKPYSILKEFKLSDAGSDYSLRDLSNNELAFIKYDKFSTAKPAVYRFNFKQSGNEVKLNTEDKNAIPGIIVNAELVKNGSEIDQSREEAFVTNNGGTLKRKEDFETKFRLVQRDKSLPLVILGDDLTQETQKIGNIKESGQYVNKVFMKQLAVYLPNGQKVAEASYPETNANSAHVMTMKDGKAQDVQINPGSKPRKQVLDWLIRNNYL